MQINADVTLSFPVAQVPAGQVRLRLLNGANARIFDLRFSDGRPSRLLRPTAVTLLRQSGCHIWIAPGERHEVLVDFSNGAAVVLETSADQNIPMMGMMRGSEPFAGGGSVMKFQVDPTKRAMVTSVPKTLVDVPLLDRSKVVARRQFLS